MTAPPAAPTHANDRPSAALAAAAPFVAALGVLLAAGGYMQYGKAHGSLQILKRPAPPQRELSELRRGCLEPYAVIDSIRLPEETEAELGTKAYVQWTIEDRNAPEDSWARRASLFLTYYTGNADQVPHVPEECYVQNAFQQAADDPLRFALPRLERTIDVRRLTFSAPSGRGQNCVVYYSFCVNGDFYADRMGVRRRMAWWSEKYLYYAKIELAFQTREGRAAPDMDRLAERLFGQVIPELVKEHLPDVKRLERQAAAARNRSDAAPDSAQRN